MPELQSAKNYLEQIIYILIGAMLLMLVMVVLVLYQVLHKPIPFFSAVTTDGRSLSLTSYQEPNFAPSTLLNWASKAAVEAYTLDFVNYDKEINSLRSYFTKDGWTAYLSAVADAIARVKKGQLIVTGVVTGAPVIASQGELSGQYFWRVQMPFLVTYQSADETRSRNYLLALTIVKIPTIENPTGLGIDRFETL